MFVQERIPGVGLNVAWSYLSQSQKNSFTQRATEVLQKLRTVTPPDKISGISYVFPDLDPDLDPVKYRGCQELERDLIFAEDNSDPDLGLMHNDLTKSNIIVNNNRIVGVVDWEMAGFFGWKTAAAVHVEIRSPKRESYAALKLSEEFMQYLLFWNDLYMM